MPCKRKHTELAKDAKLVAVREPDVYAVWSREVNRVMTTGAAARMLNVHISTVERWCDEGVLVAKQCPVTGRWIIAKGSVARMINS
jgi:hypothetical protein